MFGNIQIYIEKMFGNTKIYAKRMFGNTKMIKRGAPFGTPRLSFLQAHAAGGAEGGEDG